MPGAAERLAAFEDAAISLLVLLFRRAAEQAGHADPAGEVNDPPNEHKGRAEPNGLEVGFLAALHGVPLRVLGDERQTIEHGEEQHGQKRQRAGRRLQDAPQQQAPDAAGDVLQHEEHQAAQRAAQPVVVRHQVGQEELPVGIDAAGQPEEEPQGHERGEAAAGRVKRGAAGSGPSPRRSVRLGCQTPGWSPG